MELPLVSLRYSELPDAWDLTDEWLERLEVPEATRRHYGHLSVPERRKLEADRQLIEHYRNKGLLQDGRSTKGIIRRVAQDLDRIWLVEGKGRAVDFVQSLDVLNTYATYKAWADSLPNSDSTILDVVIPYWLEGQDANSGMNGWLAGAFRLQADIYGANVGKLGEIQWTGLTITLNEVSIVGKPDKLNFEKDPFAFIRPDMVRSVACSGARDNPTIGLLGWIWIFNAIMNPETIFPNNAGKNYDPGADHNEIHVDKPSAGRVQAFFDWIALSYWPYRVPSQSEVALQFNVASNLSSITAFTRPNNRDLLGVFYKAPKR